MTNPSIFKAPEQAPRVGLRRYLVPDQDHNDPILKFGKKTPGQRGGLRVVGSATKVGAVDLDSQIMDDFSAALVNLRKHSLSKEEGPYADPSGLVAAMASDILSARPTDDHGIQLEKLSSLEQMALLTFDVLRPRIPDEFGEHVERNIKRTLVHHDYRFVLNPRHIPNIGQDPDFALPTAGAVLSDNGRVVVDNVTGTSERTITHPFEAITLAVACLREIAEIKKMRVEIFPAFAISRNMDNPDMEERVPVVIIHDPSADKPLITFALHSIYPAVGSFDILSDSAALGFQYGMLAHNVVRAAFKGVAEYFETSYQINESAIDAAAISAGQLMAQFHANYPGDMAQERLGGIQDEAQAAFTVLAEQLGQLRLMDMKIERAKELRAAQLYNEAVARKKSGFFGFLKSANLSEAELRVIGERVESEYADPNMTREKLVIGQQVNAEFADNSLVVQSLRERVMQDGAQSSVTFIQSVLQSLARELTRLGIHVDGEEVPDSPANDTG